jgi:hypothetical protein
MHAYAPNGTLCDTTLTPRYNNPDCDCPTYPDNLGPCNPIHFEVGANGRCVYCDHDYECHPGAKRLIARELAASMLEDAIANPNGITAKVFALPEVQERLLDIFGIRGVVQLPRRPLALQPGA